MNITRLKQSAVKEHRNMLLAKNGYVCALCGEALIAEDAVLDHSHKSGRIRNTIHRSCNALLGKIENNYKRVGIVSLKAFLEGVLGYMQKESDVYHPSFRTEEEKRLRRNKKARNRRNKNKNNAK